MNLLPIDVEQLRNKIIKAKTNLDSAKQSL